MEKSKFLSQERIQNNIYKNKISNIEKTEEKENNKIYTLECSDKKKRKTKKKIEIFPIIGLKNRSKKNLRKDVKKRTNKKLSKNSTKNLILKEKEKNTIKIKNNEKFHIYLKTEIPLTLDEDNDDSSDYENLKNNNTNNNKIVSTYFNKSMYACKTRKKNNNDSKSLNDVFKELLNIKHKIKDVKKQKRNKVFQFKTILKESKNSKTNKDKSDDLKRDNRNNNSTRNKHNISNNIHFLTFNNNSKIITPKSTKPNINIVNFKKSASSYRRFNDHIKYILHIRESEMSSLANQFQKALDENEKEKDFHYKNRIFPLEIIERLNKIKDDLTLNKYRNEYFKRLDRYDIQPLKRFLSKEKKNVATNKAKIFKGLFSNINNIK